MAERPTRKVRDGNGEAGDTQVFSYDGAAR
jgi:hypothetical protein